MAYARASSACRLARSTAASAASRSGSGGRVGQVHGGSHGRRFQGHPFGVRQVVRRADVLVLAAAEQRRQGGQEPRRVAERPVQVEFELEEVLAQEDDDLRPGEHAHVRRQAQLKGVFADESVAERVERGDGRVRVAVRDELVHADGHLLGGLVREGQREDLGWPRPAFGDEPCDPASDDLGLARPGAGHDQHRSLAVGHGPDLVRIQAAEEGVHPVDRSVRRSGSHDRDELLPGRQLVQRGGFSPRSGARSGHGVAMRDVFEVVGAMSWSIEGRRVS